MHANDDWLPMSKFNLILIRFPYSASRKFEDFTGIDEPRVEKCLRFGDVYVFVHFFLARDRLVLSGNYP